MFMQINGSKPYKREDGFTLVELAIVMIIFGLVTSTVFLGYNLFISSRATDRTVEAMDETQLALFEYQISRSYYPCPADPTLGPGDANYGREARLAPVAPAVIGQCGFGAGSVTRVQGFRDADGDGVDDNILIGAVPFRTFIDPNNNDPSGGNSVYEDYIERYGFDGWNNKLTYVVSETLTHPVTYNERNGVIDVIHENTLDEANDPDASLLDRRGIAQIVILSHGENGKGAYSRSGNIVQNCAVSIEKQTDIDNGIATQPDETTNCHNLDGVFLNGLRNDTNRDYYDDVIRYMMISKSNLWEFSGIDDGGTPLDDSDDINKVVNTNPGNVGVGIKAPTEKLHVEGEIQAQGVYAEALCDAAGTDCMLPEAIGGELDDMQCPPGQVVTQIEQNRVTCSDPFSGTSLTGTCPAGTFMRGVSSKSGLICN